MNSITPRFKERHDDAKRLAYIRTLPCVVCFAPPPSEAAHLRLGLAGGIGMKPKDIWTVSLCAPCHRRQHQQGEVAFWREEINNSKPLLVTILRGYAESLKP